jgi:hypothetical protein
MDRSRYFILIALGVLLGASIEYMKDVNPQTAKIARLARLEALMDGGKVVYMPFSKRSIVKKTIHGGEVAGLDTTPAEPKSQETIVPPKKEDDAKKKAAEKKKKDDKKKKKKKKKTIKGKGETTPDSDDDSSDDDSGDSAGMGPTGGGGGAGPRADVDPNKEPETTEEWLAFLLPSPDFEKTAKFVKLYQNGAIKPDIYYEVVAGMLGDEREKMRELGVMSLGSTPSVRSFTMLSDYVTAEQGITRPKTQAHSYMKMYTRLEYLQHLVGAFTAGNAEASVAALKHLDMAAAIHLKGAPTGEPTEQDNTPRAPASNVQRYFNPIVEALTNLAQSTQNQVVRDEATSTLNHIKSAMGS